MNPTYLFAAVENSTFAIFNPETGEQLHRPAYGSNPWAGVQLSEDVFAVGGDENHIKLYSISSGDWETPIRTIQGHTNSVRGLVLIPSTNYLASSAEDHQCKLWDWEEGRCIATFTEPSRNVLAIDHSAEFPNLLFVPSDDNHIYIWDMETRRTVKNIDMSNDVDGIAHSLEHGLLFCSNDSGVLKFFDLRDDFNVVKEHQCGNAVRTLAYRPQHYQLFGTNSHGQVHVFDVRADRERLHEFSAHGHSSAYGCCDIFNGDCFVTSSWDDHVKVWNNDWSVKWDADCDHDVRGVTPIYTSWHAEGGFSGIPMEEVDEAKLAKLVACDEPWMERFKGELRLAEQSLACPRSVLAVFPGMGEDGVVTIETESLEELDATVLTSLLLGDHSRMTLKSVPSYYLLFKAGGLKKHAYLIAKYVESVESTTEMLDMLEKAMALFDESLVPEDTGDDLESLLAEEEGEEEAPAAEATTVIKSGFTLGVLNALKTRMKDITEDADTLKACHRRNLFGPIMSHEEKPLWEHEDFGLTEDEAPKSYVELCTAHFADLLQHDKFSNFRLRSGSVELPAHLDVLYLRSELVAEFLKKPVPHAALIETGVLSVEGMPTFQAGLGALLESIYCGTVQADDLATLVPLWDHAKRMNDETLLEVIVKKVKLVSRAFAKAKNLESHVAEVIHLIPNHLMKDAARIWFQIGEKRLGALKNSALTSSLSTRLERLEEQFATRFVALETKLGDMQTSMDQLLGLLQK